MEDSTRQRKEHRQRKKKRKTAPIRPKMTIRSDMSNPRKKLTWEHSLEDVEENKSDATTSTMSNHHDDAYVRVGLGD